MLLYAINRFSQLAIRPTSLEEKTMYYSDSLGFFGLPGTSVTADAIDSAICAGIRLMHVTAVPPIPKFQVQYECAVELSRYKEELTTAGNGRVRIIETADDVLTLLDDELGVLLGLQLPPQEIDARGNVGMSMEHFSSLHEQGLRVTTLAYSGHTAYGAGFACEERKYLTISGEKLVLKLARRDGRGMILDLSHASAPTARMALTRLRFTKRAPVMASHSACHAVYPHARNMPDDVLRRIAEMGGVVGIPTVTFFLGDDDAPDRFTAHVLHALQVCGEEAVCIGSDGNYQDMPIALARAHYAKMCAMLGGAAQFGARFPDHHPWLIEFGKERMETLDRWLTIGGNIPARVREKVLGTNFREFLLRSLP